MDNIIITNILTGIGTGTIVAALINKRQADRKETLLYTTAERQKWRDTIREIAKKIRETETLKLDPVITSLQVRLNPSDKFDNRIIDTLRQLKAKPDERDKLLKEVDIQIANLLKHDWERAKNEASHYYINRLKALLFILKTIIFFWITGCFIQKEWCLQIPASVQEITNWLIIGLFLIFIFNLLSVFSGALYSIIVGCNCKILKVFGIPIRS